MTTTPETSVPSLSGSSVFSPRLKVIGLGGGGCNAVNRMIEAGMNGVEFIGVNTDHQTLKSCLAPTKIQLGPKTTRGLGAGGKPEVGEAAAKESAKELAEALRGADLVFLTAGMGGGTGTGSIPVAAEIARHLGAVTISVVTTPFTFEMARRAKNANQGLAKLNQHSDTLIAISNDRLLEIKGGKMTFDLAFRVADDVLRQAVQGITELITEPGIINVDFANVRRLMKMGGGAFLGIGQGQGENKAADAIHKALNHPLLERFDLQHASGILVNFTGGDDLTLHEINESLLSLHEQASPETEIIMGVMNNEHMYGRAEVIMIITGLGARPLEEVLPGAEKLTRAPVNAAPPVEVMLQPEPVEASLQPGLAANRLDLPAFLRRPRYSGQALSSD